MTENLILRSELLNKIENISTGSVLLCAIAGYGKSVLLSQLRARAENAVVCILDHGDNVLPAFLNHLFSAVHQLLPQLEIDDSENVYTALAYICRAAAENKLTFIFDNCQVVQDDAVGAAMQSIMSATERGFKVVISSRKVPDFAVRLILEGRCKLFGRDDLSLSESEVAGMVKMHLKAKNLQLAKTLYTLTEGWAAGVSFCLRCCYGCPSENVPIWESIIKPGFMKQYIAYEILSGLPKSVEEFAKRASLFDCLSIEFCDIVLDTDNSQECLNYLRDNDIFLRECLDKPKFFVWIDIFKKIMRSFLPAREKTLIVEKATEYYFRRKMYLKAVDIAIQFEQPALICKALSFCGASLLEKERFDLLGSCARVLEKSGEILNASIYGILAQYYYVVGDYPKMEYNFNMADSMFGKENNYSIQRSLYRGLLKYEQDPQNYRKHINNALFYLNEYNLKLPILLPREQKVLEKIKRINSSDEKTQEEKPLKVKQFGSFKVIVAEDGRELPWRTKKGGELFAYLISLNGKAIERNRLFDIIWQDELPNNPVAMLHNMIYNIRKELSAYKLEHIVQYKNKKYSLDMSLIDCDMDAISCICSAISHKDIDMLLTYEGVIFDYWGVYLENIDSLWVREQKDYYDKMFISGSLLLADYYYNNSIYEKALAYLKNALKVDIFSERIMEKILDCYSRMGKFDKVRTKYGEFCKMLEDELAIQPSARLNLIYQQSLKRKI